VLQVKQLITPTPGTYGQCIYYRNWIYIYDPTNANIYILKVDPFTTIAEIRADIRGLIGRYDFILTLGESQKHVYGRMTLEELGIRETTML
jgi:hypothetical protein